MWSTMSNDKENERFKTKLQKIREAKTKDELPSASLSSVTSFMANNSTFKGKKIRTSEFNPVLKAILECNNFIWTPEVKRAYIKVLENHFPGRPLEEYESKFKKIASSSNISHYIVEASERARKLAEFREQDELKAHKETMKQIDEAFELKDLPKIGVGTLNGKIMKATKNDFIPRFSIEQIRRISDMLLSDKYSEEDIEEQIYTFCQSYGLGEEDTTLMYDQIEGSFFLDNTIGYTIEELKAKEKRVLQIYRMDHDEVMTRIKDATRIAQMPPNLTESTLTSYLSGNTTIFPRGDRISTTDLKDLTALLLSGENFDSYVVEEELRTVTAKYYPDRSEEAFALLKEKLRKLPRTNYLVEEINASNQKQAELIGKQSSNVNIYFIPNPKSPIDGGFFYNVYKNSETNLDLSALLPENLLDIESIIPDGMDVDSIEYCIQTRFDPSFKLIGGVILNRDESIGNINVFRPSGGPIGITPEQNRKRIEFMSIVAEIDKLLAAKEENDKTFQRLKEAHETQQNTIKNSLKELKQRLDALGLNQDKSDDEKNGTGKESRE